MDTTRRRERRRTRHSTKLARRSIGEAGSPTQVGKALDRSPSTVCHEAKDREHPALRDAFAVLVRLDAYPGVSGRAFVEACAEAVELSEIVHAEDATLIERGVWLLDEENRRDGEEDSDALVGPERHAEALRRWVSIASELAAILDELVFRGIDLHAEYRAARMEVA